MNPVSVLCVSVALSACVTDLETSSRRDAVMAGGGGSNTDPCPKTGCGTNSPFLGPTEFHELESTGTLANKEGFRLVSLVKNGFSYMPDVKDSILVGRFWGIVQVAHQDLTGAELLIHNDLTNEGFRIKIDRVVVAQQFWRPPYDTFETYELSWRVDSNLPDHYKAVCNNPPDRLDPDGKLYGDALEAILYTGDRYDTDSLTVTATTKAASGTWFNIACAGNVMSKLFLNRHTDASQTAAFPTTLVQRQAMLKMYTSDLCGTGQAYTVQGTPLHWVSSAGWSSVVNYPNSEAGWSERGALCLDTHRLHKTINDMTSQYGPVCGARLPACTPLLLSNAYLRTSSPALP